MICLFCKNQDTEVIETRVSENGTVVRRRRQCVKCEKRFTTYERVEELPLLVVKRDGRRERFDREKLRRGILRATGKTTVTAEQIENIISHVEGELKQGEETEIESKTIGNLVARQLKKIDKVAYIRFASVFRRFVDVEEFEKEVKKLL
ncbi:transcriptional repressor NrdR [Candidatus Roizmanbacteria bacterium]|nr:transcriptional repressor NrdR [Candidatus Roizmanbacteria bacterium]